MRKTILTVLLLLLATGLKAQLVEYAYFDARGSFNGTWENQKFGSRLTADNMNFHLKGHFTPNLHYRLRQRFTKPLYDPKYPLNCTDILTLTWDINPHWTLEGGKFPVFIGGYEWEDAPIDIYYHSDFSETIPAVYAFGGRVYYHLNEKQLLLMEVTQSLLADGHADVWNVDVGWEGQFAKWWKTIWGVNVMDDYYRHLMCYVALGNRFEVGPAALELDGIYRRSLKQKHAGIDLSLIARFTYTVGRCVINFKGGYDVNNASNVDPDGIPYDLTVAPGTSYLWASGGVEYFPLKNNDIRIHAMAMTDNRNRTVTFKTGLTIRLYIKKPVQ